MSETSGWSFERGTTERADDNGWVIAEPTDNAEFVCHEHGYASGVLPVARAREAARAHLAEEHPTEPNPFADDGRHTA